MREHLDADTESNLQKIPESLCTKWGHDGVWDSCNGMYREKTVVRSGEDAIEAFEHYTEYFTSMLDEWVPSSDTLVLVPCGASKPIGSSTIHQKKVSAIREGGLQDADVVVVSEPCTIVPPEYRLSLAAANYDFPPQFTEKDSYPDVFEVFTDRLAQWLDKMDYDTIYPYLISGHQSKFDAALGKMDTDPTVYSIPSASYNAQTESYSGDRFKKLEDMREKVKAVLRVKAGEEITVNPEYKSFYQSRF